MRISYDKTQLMTNNANEIQSNGILGEELNKQYAFVPIPKFACCNIVVVVVVLLFYVHGKHLRSCRDGQLT